MMGWRDRAHVFLLRLLRPGEERSAQDEEIRFHLEMEQRKLMSAGVPAPAARELAAARFGDVDRVRLEPALIPRILEDGMNDLRHSIRGLIRRPGFTLLALLTLALGIGATTVAFSLVDGVLLRPLPYADSDRLVLIEEVTEEGRLLAASYPNFVDWRVQAAGFSGMASAMHASGQSVRGAGEPVRVQAVGVSDGFFRVLGVTPVLGRDFTAEESRPASPLSVIVTHEFWQAHLGGERDLSRASLRAFGGPVAVVGVLPPAFRFLGEASVYYPHEREPVDMRSGHNYRVIGRLAPGVTLPAAQSNLSALSARLKQQFGDDTQAVDARATPLLQYVVGDQARLLALMLSAAGLVLLIACANLASSQLARGASRRHEFAVRTVLGAGRTRLIRQLGTESLVLAILGAVVGTVLAAALLEGIRLAGSGMLPRLDEVRVDGRVLVFTSGVTLLTAVLVGLLPSLRMSKGLDTLRSRGGTSGFEGRSPVWRLLVGFEAALAMLLIVACGLLIRTLQNILTVNPGFDSNGVLTVTMSPEQLDFAAFEQLERAVASLPGVESAGMINLLPLTWGSTAGPVLRPSDVPPNWPAYAGFRVISPTYFDAMRMPVLRGRAFSADDRENTAHVAIVSEPLAERLWPGEDPIGKTVRSNYLSQLWLTVVGVVPEARLWAEPAGGQHEIYTPIAQHPARSEYGFSLVIRARGEPGALAPLVRARLRELAPELPVVMRTMEERVASTFRDRTFATLVLAGFALTALLLAAMGIYGVVSYTTAVRTREIGVRIALGATPAGVRRDVVANAARVAGAGIALGILGGLLASRALQGLLFGVEPMDPLTFISGALLLLLVALAAAYVPARRSSRVDPLVAMRLE